MQAGSEAEANEGRKAKGEGRGARKVGDARARLVETTSTAMVSMADGLCLICAPGEPPGGSSILHCV
jgi:hypothetical protein